MSELDIIELPQLHKNQIKVIQDPCRFKVIVAGRRFGKTRLSILYSIKTAMNGGRVWFIAPTYNMTQDSYREFKHFANQIPNTNIREVEKRIEFSSGGFIQCKSGDNPDRLRGAGLDLVILDEVAFMKKDVWEVIRPTLTDRQGEAIFISTPNGMGTWFHELTMKAETLNNWAVFRFTSFDNPYIAKEEIEGAREELGSLVFSQEYLAEFTEFGAIFRSEWARFYDTTERIEYDDNGNNIVNTYYQLDDEEVVLSECRKYCTVDLAASTKTTADYTVIVTVAVTPKNNFIVAVSGGPDSLALAFFSKIYSIKKSLKVKYFIVDHKLRSNSSTEALFVKGLLKNFSIDLNILKWIGKKPTSNIQSVAREQRYKHLIQQTKKLKINNILLGHHINDVFENFFIRFLRGSGLNGMVSLDKKSVIQNVNILRPLIHIEKQDLIYVTKKVFNTYVEDPSNNDENFTRVRVRNLIAKLEAEGFDKKKFKLTIKNLKHSNNAIKFFYEKNLRENSVIFKNKAILNEEFFNYPEEVLFRSFSQILKLIGNNHFFARGKKIKKILEILSYKTNAKCTLGNCVIEKINKTVIVLKER